MAKHDDSLFLLEVLIDKIVFVKSPCFSDKDFKTCVNIECPAVPPLEICDDDPGVCIARSGGPFVKTFNNGKSCLFSLKESDISSAMSKFPIKVSVYKSLPCGCLPTKIVMGEATIDMTKEFVQARNKYLEDPSNVSYQALKDSFRIVGPDGTETGEVVMFLRISCFGKLIITRFQGAGGAPNLGASGSNAIVDRSCATKRDFQTAQDPCACGAARSAPGKAGSAGPNRQTCVSEGGGGGVCQSARDPYNSMPCEDPDDPCYCSGPMAAAKPNMVCRNTDQYCLHVPKGRSKQFEEIGTVLGGNELKIKVPASASIIKKISQTHCAMQSPYTKGKDGGPCEPPCGKNQISLALPTEAICCQGAQPAETQFTCTTEGCVQTSKHSQQIALGRGDAKQQELPNKEVFVLKVAKTAIQGDKKCKLELELVAPKGPDKKPPTQKVNSRLQSDLDCECCVRRLKKQKGKKKHKYPELIVGPSPSAPIWQEMNTERWTEFKARDAEQPQQCLYDNISEFVRSYSSYYLSKLDDMHTEYIQWYTNKIDLPDKLQHLSNTSITSIKYSKYIASYANDIRISRSQNSVVDDFKTGIFGRSETEVYMTLFSDYYHCRASGTQATAFINKCLQVNCDLGSRCDASTFGTNSNYASSCTMSSTFQSGHSRRQITESTRYHDIYFFGRKKDSCKSTGMGSTGSNTKLHRTKQSPSAATKNEKCCSAMKGSSTSAQTKNTKGASTATNTMKAVSIKDDKPKKPCPASAATKGDMAATVSHIRIGPKEPCPVHGKEPCQGPKCIVASSGEEQAAVKVTTVTNPRRGVFELVIRKMTGAPLAKNELMLEWTPPPSRPPPCAGPCPIPCAVPTACRPSKCKIIVCKPSPCKPKCCKKPCGQTPCRGRCKKCCKISCCGKKCNACGPPCSVPCGGNPCSVPCKSSPCLRPCPVGRKRPRKARSQPKIKMNRKRTSPCLNRSKTCPVVRCRSMPGPCVGCCGIPPCPPRKCCSVSPCKPPKCCKSSCSVCCI